MGKPRKHKRKGPKSTRAGFIHDHKEHKSEIHSQRDSRMLDRVRHICRKRSTPSELSITEAFAELAEAADGRWDGVDATEYVRELRGE